jgi:hypothetical protein
MDSPTGPAGLRRRLSFAATPEAIACSAYLTGLLVAIDTDANRRAELAGVLATVGIDADAHPHHGFTFPISRLYRAADLPSSVTVDVDVELEVLWQLALRYGSGKLDGPATLQVSAGRPLLRWESADGGDDVEGVLTTEAAGALLHSQLPFIASAEAWEAVATLTRMPLQAATLRQHRDGYVEIRAMRPQQVESAPIPGLWRIDQTTYGAPLPYAPRLSAVDGLRWEEPAPEPAATIVLPRRIAEQLDGHVADGARHLAQLVRDHGSAVVAWPSGLGRRVAALAALDAVDSLPVQILAPRWAVWSWVASLTALGLADDEQARVVTWDAVAAGAALHATPSFIVDDFTSAAALAATATLRRLETFDGVARIGVCAQWPADVPTLLQAMHLVRPGEFPETGGGMLRYPLWPTRRATEHADAYRIPLPPLSAGRPYRRRFDVRTVELSALQRRHLDELITRYRAGDSDVSVETLREATSAGTAQALSAKVSQVAGAARTLLQTGQQVLVVARHDRTLQLVRTLVRGAAEATIRYHTWATVERDDTGADDADTVLVCDYPDHPEQLWRVAGVPGDAEGAAVLLWHTRLSVDDEVAVSAARGMSPTDDLLLQACLRGVVGDITTPGSDEFDLLR